MELEALERSHQDSSDVQDLVQLGMKLGLHRGVNHCKHYHVEDQLEDPSMHPHAKHEQKLQDCYELLLV